MVRRRIDELEPWDRNPRMISDDAMEGLSLSVQRWGLVQPIIVNTRSGHVVGGHQRLRVLVAQGAQTTDVIEVDLPDEEEAALNIALNSPTIAGEFTDEAASIIAEIDSLVPKDVLDGVGITQIRRDIEKRIKEAAPKPDGQIDPGTGEAAERTKEGEVWVLGAHRLMVGDSTNHDHVSDLLGSTPAQVVMTSPPYWVGMEYEQQETVDDILAFIDDIADMLSEFVQKNDSRIVIQTGTTWLGEQGERERIMLLAWWQDALRKRGWLLRHVRHWIKQGNMMRGRDLMADMVDQYVEHIGTFYHPAGHKRGRNRIPDSWFMQGYWELHGESRGAKHCASFPLEIPMRCLRLYAREGEIVFEPFGGAGTTMIACERLGMKCRTMEIYARYADIAIARWEEMTGRKATRENY